MKKLVALIVILFSLVGYSQKKYIQNKDGRILTETDFYKEKDEIVAKTRKKLGKYFDIIYEFEKPIESNDSIIIKVAGFRFTSYPPQMNINNVFDEDKIKGKLLSINTLKTLDGRYININDLQGKPTIVNFWHTACGPCVKEMPALNEIKKMYGDTVNFIAVTFESKDKVSEFLTKREFDFMHVIDAANFMNSIQIKEFPKTLYLDKKGVVQKVEDAILSDEMKDKAIKYINTLL